MAASEDVQKSSSMPSTPQSFLYFETDSPYPQSTNEEVWPTTKRRRTQRTSSETQFIHMNGYKSDSQLGTRFNNTYVDSYSDSKTFDNSQNKSADAASAEEDAVGVESASKGNEERSEPASTKSTRSSRKPMERSTETSSRVLKVKSGTGSSQPTNIQTFIFKTKLDPRMAYREDRSDEPATPSSATDNSEVKIENPLPAASEPPAKSTRKSRKSEANILKFKSYTPNATPVLRNTGRKPSRQEQFVDTCSPIPTQRSPTSTVDDYDVVFGRSVEQEKQRSPDKTTQFETPSKDEAMADAHEVNSTHRRSTRIRKPVSTIVIGETPKRQKHSKESVSTPVTQTTKSGLEKSNPAYHGQSNVSPSTPAVESNILYGSRDDAVSERFGTPSPDGLSANTRTSGRLRKPTIKAIEALQSKPRTRKRLRDSDNFMASGSFDASIPLERSTPEPANAGNASVVSMSRSTSGVGSEPVSFSLEEPDILGRLLYDLAKNALADAISTNDNDLKKIDEWREAFKKKKTQEAVDAANQVQEQEAQVPSIIDNMELPGEVNEEIPLDNPDKRRPWAEENGWTHTGRVNKFGEEYCVAPADKYQWVKHASNYRTPAGPIPTPPPFIKSVDEIRRDNIYGFPPSPGTRNLYQKHPGQVWRHENVEGLVSQLGSIDGSGAGDAMDIDEPGRKTRYIHKRGLPRFKRPLKLVLVDSTKLKLEGGPDKSTLRRRRQSAPIFAAEGNNKSKSTPAKASASGTRKRSLDMSGLKSAESSKPIHPPQRRKRQSIKNEAKAGEKSTPGRYKRQSTLMFSNNSQPVTPATQKSAAGGPKGSHNASNSLGARTTQSEKAASKYGSGDSLGTAHEESATTPTTISGRSRRRTLGLSKPNEI